MSAEEDGFPVGIGVWLGARLPTTIPSGASSNVPLFDRRRGASGYDPHEKCTTLAVLQTPQVLEPALMYVLHLS